MIILYVYFLIFLSVVLFVSDYCERLCELRTEKGISQKEAARDLSVSQALLSHYERGIREFGLDFLNRAADYYGVTTDYLLGRSDSRSGLNSEYLEDRTEDGKFTAQTVYRAAIMTHERMQALLLRAKRPICFMPRLFTARFLRRHKRDISRSAGFRSPRNTR